MSRASAPLISCDGGYFHKAISSISTNPLFAVGRRRRLPVGLRLHQEQKPSEQLSVGQQRLAEARPHTSRIIDRRVLSVGCRSCTSHSTIYTRRRAKCVHAIHSRDDKMDRKTKLGPSSSIVNCQCVKPMRIVSETMPRKLRTRSGSTLIGSIGC